MLTLADAALSWVDTTTDSITRISIDNDSQRWQLRTSGDESDSFNVVDVTGSTTSLKIDAAHSSRFVIGDKTFQVRDADTDGDVVIQWLNDAVTWQVGVEGSDGDDFFIKDITGNFDKFEIANGDNTFLKISG